MSLLEVHNQVMVVPLCYCQRTKMENLLNTVFISELVLLDSVFIHCTQK